MTSRKWVYLFVTTLILGGISTIITGFVVEWERYASFFSTFNYVEIISITIWLLGIGFIFSLISQMGFFAYLTVHRFGLGFFKSLWNPVQLVITAFVLFDLVYFRYQAFANEEESVILFIIPPILILLYGLLVAYWKMKQTNKHAFIPALFFMVSITIIEWVPALRANEKNWLLLMIIPILICNTWQLLLLHKLNQVKEVK